MPDPFDDLDAELGITPQDLRRFGVAPVHEAERADAVVPYYIATHSIPGASAAVNVAQSARYSLAQHRLRSGRQLPPGEQAFILHYEREQDEAARRQGTWGGAITDAVASAPAVIGEALIGGQVVRGAAAAAPRALGWLAPAAGRSAAARLGGYAAERAITTPLLPSVWAPEWTQGNIAAGRDPADPRGLPAAFGAAYLNNLVLGSLGPIGNRAPGGILGRTAARAVAMPVEQAIADVMSGAAGLRTGYGTLEEMWEGRHGEASQHLAVQALTGAAFGLMHEIGRSPTDRPAEVAPGAMPGMPGPEAPAATPGPESPPPSPATEPQPIPPLLDAFAAVWRGLHRRGMSANAAARTIHQEFVEPLRNGLENNPNPTASDVRAWFNRRFSMPAMGEFADSLAESIGAARESRPTPDSAPPGPQLAPAEAPGSLRINDLGPVRPETPPVLEPATATLPERLNTLPAPPAQQAESTGAGTLAQPQIRSAAHLPPAEPAAAGPAQQLQQAEVAHAAAEEAYQQAAIQRRSAQQRGMATAQADRLIETADQHRRQTLQARDEARHALLEATADAPAFDHDVLQAEFAALGLNERQRTVLIATAEGKRFEDIHGMLGLDPATKNKRESPRKILKSIVETLQLDLPESIQKIIERAGERDLLDNNTLNRIEGEVRFTEKQVRQDPELRQAVRRAERPLDTIERTAKKLRVIRNKWLKAKTPEERAEYEQQANDIARGVPGRGTTAATAEANPPAAVPPEGGSLAPEPPNPGQPPAGGDAARPAAESAPGNAAPAEAPASPAPAAAAQGRQASPVAREFEQHAIEAGILPEHLHQAAAQMLSHSRESIADVAGLIRTLRKDHPELRTIQARAARGIDQDAVRGLDDIAQHMIPPEFEHLFAGSRDREHRLFEILTAGTPKPISEEAAYRQALDYLHDVQRATMPTAQEVQHVNADLRRRGLATLDPAEVAAARRIAAEEAGESAEASGSEERQPGDVAGGVVEDALGIPFRSEPGQPTQLPGEPQQFTPAPGAVRGRTRRPGGLNVEPFKQFGDDVKKFLAPAARGPDARAGAGVVRESLAEMVRRQEIAKAALNDSAAYFDRWMPSDPAMRTAAFLHFFDAMEHGQIANLPDPIRGFAETMRRLIDERTDLVRSRGLVQTFLDDYVGHLWQNRGSTLTPEEIGRMMGARRPLSGREGFRKERFYETYRDGIDAGLEPIDWNPARLVLRTLEQVDKAVMGRDVVDQLALQGRWQFKRLGDKIPEGWRRIDDKLATVFKPRQAGAAGPELVGHYYTPEPVARLLDNYLTPGLRGNMVYDAIRGFGNILNQFQLGFSAFHLGFVVMDTQASAVALGLQRLSRGDVAGAGIRAVTAPFEPFLAMVRGNKVLAEYYRPGSQGAEMAALVDSLMEGGGRSSMDDFYGGTHLDSFRRAMREARAGKIGGAGSVVLHALPALSEALATPVMQWIVPRMKLAVFAEMARYETDRLGPQATAEQRREAMGRAWDSVENRLGQMTYDNVFWNRTLKDILMAAVRSVGWNLGTWRELGGGVVDIPSSAVNTARGQGISPRLAYIAGMVLVAGVYGAMYQYLATGEGPKEPKDLFFPRNGSTRADGSPDRVSLPSYMRDVHTLINRGDEGPLRLIQNVGEMGRHKINPGLTVAGEMLFNRDFFDRPIRNPNHSAVQQSGETALHLLQSFESFSVRALHDPRQQDRTIGQRTQAIIGITPAPSNVTRPWEQQRAIESRGRR